MRIARIVRARPPPACRACRGSCTAFGHGAWGMGSVRCGPLRLPGITQHGVALKDSQLVGDRIKTADLKMGAPTTRTVNGQLNPRIGIRPGETQLWRLASIGAGHRPGERRWPRSGPTASRCGPWPCPRPSPRWTT